ncbi:TrkH family potassium uptake protein [Desmospora activa]|uniref:Trk-type K+ transport system membrane component n=1 Tax=Desmospora activa DSM 45169 TaxID=1121389 RepID=A0A2T4Z1Z2_9BACL|nr:TrkH family potassium uptake protein [Desmospora activa]PTM54806.1 Trk-type K+ transport system membrane component [Desmospora activa DSM 45169]
MKLSILKLTPVQLLVLIYFSAILLSSILLFLPAAHRPGVEVSYLDALFTAATAITVTGLTVVNTAETYSTTGHVMLMVMLQFGGIGFMTLGTFLWMATGQRIGIMRRRMIMLDQNQLDLAGLVRLMRDILLISLLIEAVGALLLGLYFYFVLDYGSDAFLYGLFSSLSAFTNGGLDIFGNSLEDFSQDYFVQVVHMLLILGGVIGFPVLVEVKEWFASPNRKQFRFSLFTKLTVTTHFALIAISVIVFTALESQRFYSTMPWHEAFFYSLFNAITARSGGLATMDLNEYSLPSQLFLSFMMFIGASPSSVGGGIRTTTLAVVLLAIFCYARGQNHIRLFGRELMEEDVRKASVVFATGAIIVAVAVLVVMVEQPQHSMIKVVFEVCSAFGTTGLSLGLSPELSAAGKLTIIAIMFMGRIGILLLLFLIRKERPPASFHYPRERVIIG